MDTKTETTQVNWDDEYEEVEARIGGNWFKPEAETTYEIKFLDEGKDLEPKTFDDGRTVHQRQFKIQVGEEEYDWSLTKGGTESLYGMLVALFKQSGRASGLVVHVRASGDGKNRRYTVKEFNDLQFLNDGEE